MGVFLDDYEALHYLASIENWTEEEYKAKVKELEKIDKRESNIITGLLLTIGLIMSALSVIGFIVTGTLGNGWWTGFLFGSPFLIFGILRLLDII